MTAGAILHTLWKRGVELSTDGRSLFITPPNGDGLSPYLMADIAKHKPLIILALLAAGPGQPVKLEHIMTAHQILQRER